MCRDLLVIFAAFTAATVPMSGQTYERRATLTGSSSYGQGKCTVEVVVDGMAEVEIRGDRGFLRNLAGQAPQWRRFECTASLPLNPTDFQFSGVDGRGTQQLSRDPRNGGAAVVRISDSQGGSEAYTFDLRWTGGSTYSSSPSIFDNTPYGNNGQRISTDEAIRLCQDNVRQQVAQRFNTSDVEFRRTIVEDNRGGRDLIAGAFAIRNFSNDRPEVHRFSCSMNFNNGRVQSVLIDQQQYQQRGSYTGRDGYYGDRGALVDSETARVCERAVTDRIRRDGYQRYSFGRMNMDTGNNIVGSVTADRGNVSDSFDFTCFVNGNSGRIRSLQVNRR